MFCPATDDEYGERSVSVNLDGEESELIFIDHPEEEISVSLSRFLQLAACMISSIIIMSAPF